MVLWIERRLWLWRLLWGFSLALLLGSCRPSVEGNFDLRLWKGEDLDANPVLFDDRGQDSGGPGLILNFYSPICQPCIEELPALERLYERARQRKVAIYLAVESDAQKHGIEVKEADGDRDRAENRAGDRGMKERSRQLLVKRLLADRRKYDIRIPFVLMWEGFRIGPGELVTATPETLFFKKAPLRLVYNFIGPLSDGRTEQELSNSSRLNFALKQLERL